ncbi:hypothetical protein CEUSTIGMA_g4041.t1 [Chlamydomonas eustigma]|uniref:Uncharacterized protein n=1 Tax=Chlamydomonas eustigma TaxID=1157962 RepID=A0A250X0L8_9CHLO|nr:hypothetical protein CEUSTIGMA_g4041.t1 [Chlamydomonas eustigma]|eukprot:GAX76595.1 hypothetical protein CEUSTIGMA_g4041.t1 [Chlamydomonas eustigma]
MQSSSANAALCATSGMEAMESLMQLLHAESIQVQAHQRHNTYNCSQSEAGAIHSRTNFNQQPSSLMAMTISEPGGLPLDQNIQQPNHQFIAAATKTDSATGFGNLQGTRRAERLTANDVVEYESPLCGGVNLMSRCRSMGGAASNMEDAKEQLGGERLQPVHMDELVEEPGRKQQLRKLEPIGPPSHRVTENQLHWGVAQGLPDGFTNSQVPVHGGGLGFEGLQVPLPLKGERKPEAAGVPVINQLFDQPSLLCAARDLYAAHPARSSIPSTQINNMSDGMHGIGRAALKGANPALCYGTQSTLDQFNLQDEELILRFLEAEEEIPIHKEMHRVANMQHANRCQQHNAQQQYMLQAMANSASGSSGQQQQQQYVLQAMANSASGSSGQQQQQLAPFITPELLSEVMWMLESGVNFSHTSPAAPQTAAASPYHQLMASMKVTVPAPPYFQRGQNQAQALHQRNMNNHQVPGCYTSGRVNTNPHKMYNKGST